MIESLIDNVPSYLDMAKYALQKSDEDEIYLNRAAYNIQQAFELTFKYLLSKVTVDYPYKHEFNLLLHFIRDNNIRVYVPDFIIANCDMIDNWESKSRYNINYIAERNKLVEALKVAEHYYKVAVTNNEFTENEMITLRSCIPNSRVRSNNLMTDQDKDNYLFNTYSADELRNLLNNT